MNKYKVEFTRTNVYCIDVLAKTEQEAINLAKDKFIEIENAGMLHYHETGDENIDNTVYDVTNTDDEFNPQ